MKIENLLSVAGDSPLKLYVWGAGVAETINIMLPVDRRITTEITGTDAKTLIRTLPGEALSEMLKIELDPATGQPAVVTAPAVEVKPVIVSPTPVATRLFRTPGHLIAAVAGAGIVVVALMMAFAVTVTSIDKGEAPDAKAMDGIVSILHDVVKAYTGSEAAPAPQQLPPPATTQQPAEQTAPPHEAAPAPAVDDVPGHPP